VDLHHSRGRDPPAYAKTVNGGHGGTTSSRRSSISLLTAEMSRLGESNPRPTHYDNSRHRIHHAHTAHPCTSNRSPCSTRACVGRHFVPRIVPRSILPAYAALSLRRQTETSSRSPRTLNLRILVPRSDGRGVEYCRKAPWSGKGRLGASHGSAPPRHDQGCRGVAVSPVAPGRHVPQRCGQQIWFTRSAAGIAASPASGHSVDWRGPTAADHVRPLTPVTDDGSSAHGGPWPGGPPRRGRNGPFPSQRSLGWPPRPNAPPTPHRRVRGRATFAQRAWPRLALE